MRISVALCTYNGEKYLPQQLDSLLRQERVPDQIVIRDDVSGDGTWRLLEAFVSQAHECGIEVDLRRNENNLGYVRNFEQAIAAANGELVFLCDQDDVWHADKICRMEEEFERRHRLVLLHTDARLVDGNDTDLGYGLFDAIGMTPMEFADEHAGRAFEVLLRRNTVTGATVAVRSDVLKNVPPAPDGWVHDEWLAMALGLAGEVDCLQWKSIDYRQHGSNQIGVRRYSLYDRVARTGMPKREFMESRLRCLRALQEKLNAGELAGTPEQVDRVVDRVAHARLRAQLPDGAMKRMAGVLKEAMTGRYMRYSSGMRSIVSDLLGLA